MKRHLIVIVCLLTWFCSTHAADGAELRTWTSKSGKYTVNAELLSFAEGVATLRRANGKKIAIPLDKLSKGDQIYVFVTRRLKSDVKIFTDAYLDRDYKTVVSYFPDRDIAQMGGLDQAVKRLQKELNDMRLTFMKVNDVLSISHDGNNWLAVVSTTSRLKIEGDEAVTVKMEGSLLSFSNDNGNTWRFLDGGSDAAIVDTRRLYPKLAKQMIFPQGKRIIGDMAWIKVDGEWVPDEKTIQYIKTLADENPKLQEAITQSKIFHATAQPYENAKYGFRILFPETWKVTPGVLSEFVVKAFTKDATGKMAIITIRPKSADNGVNRRITTENEMFQKFKREWVTADVKADVKMLDSGTTTIAGADAVWIKTEVKVPGVLAMISTIYHLVHAGDIFEIVAATTPNDSEWFDQHFNQFWLSIQSLEFKG